MKRGAGDGDGLRVVAVGGGTGMPVLISALLEIVPRIDVVVTVADDGGSSGRLRQQLHVPPPGDSRNCLVAMGNGSMMGRLFQYRFPGGEGLQSHALGNLIITALIEMTGDFSQALKAAGDLLGARGRVFPPSMEPLTLFADVAPWPGSKLENAAQSPGCKADEARGEENAADGALGRASSRVTGQCNVANRLRPLVNIGIEPANAPADAGAVAALDAADVIVMGPGSLFTSVLANILVKDIGRAIRASAARKIFFCNITVQPGETDGFTAADHVAALLRFGGAGICDLVVTSNTVLPRDRLAELAEAGSSPIVVDDRELTKLGAEHAVADLTDEDYPTHHNSNKLARFLREALT